MSILGVILLFVAIYVALVVLKLGLWTILIVLAIIALIVFIANNSGRRL